MVGGSFGQVEYPTIEIKITVLPQDTHVVVSPHEFWNWKFSSTSQTGKYCLHFFTNKSNILVLLLNILSFVISFIFRSYVISMLG